MAEQNIITTQNFSSVTAREIDFVSRFAKNWDALKTLLGITRAIKKDPGTSLVSYEAKMVGELHSAEGEGEKIPFTEFEVVQSRKEDLKIDKYAKAVTIEAVAKYGASIAVEKTDEEFLNVLQTVVLTDFYDFLKSGQLTSNEDSFQMALAMARAQVIDKFNKLRRTVTDIVGFANVLDAYKYLGEANITVQTSFGIQYIKDFMGYKTLFLLSEPDIPRNTVIALPVENIDLYYIDPSDSDFAKLGLQYTVDGETNLIGFHANGNYSTATGESYALMGMKLWAEYIDGIAVVNISDVYKPLKVEGETDAFGPLYGGKVASDLQSDVSVIGNAINGSLNFIEGGLADSGPLAGDGYFLALKWANPAAGVTSLKVGLDPSIGTGLVEAINDSDRNGVFKITDKDNQRLILIQSDGVNTTKQVFSLKNLVLADIGA